MYRRASISHALTPTIRRRRPTAAAPASGANAFQGDGRAALPRVSTLEPAGQDTVTLTFESGEVVTVTACDGTAMSPDGVLFTNWRTRGPIYFIPSPHQHWQAKVWLGLYGGEQDTYEARFDQYLMTLSSITEADWTGDVLTLAYLTLDGQRRSCKFTGDVSANFIWDPSDGGFTRYPLQVAIQEGEGQNAKPTCFRVDHTPEGYAALRVLGWLAELPAANSEREA